MYPRAVRTKAMRKCGQQSGRPRKCQKMPEVHTRVASAWRHTPSSNSGLPTWQVAALAQARTAHIRWKTCIGQPEGASCATFKMPSGGMRYAQIRGHSGPRGGGPGPGGPGGPHPGPGRGPQPRPRPRPPPKPGPGGPPPLPRGGILSRLSRIRSSISERTNLQFHTVNPGAHF